MLSMRFIGPFKILKRMGKVAYELVLPPNLQQVHNIFHVSMLRKYNPETSHVIENEMVEIQPDLSYVVTINWSHGLDGASIKETKQYH